MYSIKRVGVFILLLVFFFTSTQDVYARKKRGEQNRDKTSYLLLEAQRLEQTQNPDSFVVAFEILKKALKEDELNQEARFKLSSYYKALNMPEKYYNGVLEAGLLDTTNYYYNVEAAHEVAGAYFVGSSITGSIAYGTSDGANHRYLAQRLV